MPWSLVIRVEGSYDFRALDHHDVEQSAAWLAKKEIRSWLDFGEEIQAITATPLQEINSARLIFAEFYDRCR